MILIQKVMNDSVTGGTETERALLRLISVRTAAVYPSELGLRFELRMREATMKAARDLNGSGAGFASFKDSHCNPEYWNREPNGAFRLRSDRSPADAIRDIFVNGPLYGFECATAIVIVLYKAVLDTIGEPAYNRLFANTYLFHWNVDRDLGLTTLPTTRFIPGDVLYFDNPDVDPNTMQWQGENTVYMGGNQHYGHGIGIRDAEGIIAALNSHRRPGATRSAFLMDQASRPNYVSLSQVAASLPANEYQGGVTGLPPGLPLRARIGESVYLDV